MVSLARKSLLYEWRRFLPAMLAVAFSGLLLLMQSALVLGTFGSASVYVRKSGGDLWVGYPGTQTIDLGRPITRDAELRLLMDPDVDRVESFQWQDADWRGPAERGNVSVFVSGIDPRPDGLMFDSVLSPELRMLLLTPDAVIVDRADLSKLSLPIGGVASINRHRVTIAGVASGLRALGGINVVASLETAQRLKTDATPDDRVAYYLVNLRNHAGAATVAARLKSAETQHRFSVWTRDEFANRTSLYWMFETGAGLGVILISVVVLLAGVVITSQSLMAAVAGSVREYAALQALGISVGALRSVVLEQASWIGGGGLLLAGILSVLMLSLAEQHDVPMALNLPILSAWALIVMFIAMASGLLAIRTLRQADPALLLR